jgi:hypothetical protein
MYVPKSFTDFCLILHIIVQSKYQLYSIFVYFILCFSDIPFKKQTETGFNKLPSTQLLILYATLSNSHFDFLSSSPLTP